MKSGLREIVLRVSLLTFTSAIAGGGLALVHFELSSQISRVDMILLGLVLPMIIAPLYLFLLVNERVRAAQIAEDEAEEASCDPLTGLLTRRSFFHKVNRLRAQMPADMVCFVAIVSIRHFKAINARFGYKAGDVVLAHVAECLSSCAGEDMCLARFGGEEFILAGRVKSVGTVQRFCAVMIQCIEHSQSPVRINVDVGSCVALSNMRIEKAVSRAEAALQTAKREGRFKLLEAA